MPSMKLVGLNNPAEDLISAVASSLGAPETRVEPVSDGLSVELCVYRDADCAVVYEEFVQQTVRNCDVHVFLALKDSTGTPVPESIWLDWEVAVRSACYCRHTC